MVFEGMHCAACALTLEESLGRLPGVESVQVSSASHRGRIVWGEGAVKPSDWMQAAQRAGYRALPANDAFLNERRKAEMRQAVWRIGRHDLIATLQLGLVKRLVGAQQQFARIVAVVGERGDAQ